MRYRPPNPAGLTGMVVLGVGLGKNQVNGDAQVYFGQQLMFVQPLQAGWIVLDEPLQKEMSVKVQSHYRNKELYDRVVDVLLVNTS